MKLRCEKFEQLTEEVGYSDKWAAGNENKGQKPQVITYGDLLRDLNKQDLDQAKAQNVLPYPTDNLSKEIADIYLAIQNVKGKLGQVISHPTVIEKIKKNRVVRMKYQLVFVFLNTTLKNIQKIVKLLDNVIETHDKDGIM